MNDKFNYTEFLNEFKDGMDDGILTLDSLIWVIRNHQSLEDGYRPIIEWYYLDEFQQEAPSHHKINAIKMALSLVVNELLQHSEFI